MSCGFDDPFGRLVEGHRKTQDSLAWLLRLARRAQARPLTPTEKQQLLLDLRWLRVEGRDQARDESDSLLPRLKNHPVNREPIRVLESCLGRLEEARRAVEPALVGWLEDRIPESDLASRLQTLADLDRGCLEAELGPLSLTAGERADIGREMAQRRHLVP
ncbi:MAG: hypothetical protein AB1758_07670 [Candidatus Eremiobacterota bacterium]